MAFQLQSVESIHKGMEHIVRRQIDNALDMLRLPQTPTDRAIHDIRQRFKKLRAALRLVRDGLGEKTYRRENFRFRDASRLLTEVRDAQVCLKTLSHLAGHGSKKAGFDSAHCALLTHRQAARKRLLKKEKIFADIVKSLEEARSCFKDWATDREGWQAIEQGLRRTYRQGRRAFAIASEKPSIENLHEWRKRAKYLLYQLQLLGIKKRIDPLDELTQRLGDIHDLTVLRNTAPPDKALTALIDRRRKKLQRQALALGKKMYREKPKAFTARIMRYWQS